jgi:hypothetical protein
MRENGHPTRRGLEQSDSSGGNAIVEARVDLARWQGGDIVRFGQPRISLGRGIESVGGGIGYQSAEVDDIDHKDNADQEQNRAQGGLGGEQHGGWAIRRWSTKEDYRRRDMERQPGRRKRETRWEGGRVVMVEEVGPSRSEKTDRVGGGGSGSISPQRLQEATPRRTVGS